ncbi:histidinol dehydrogenase [Aegicerativicinus sediminis]|uniref:histidinol dehydrogenase n=1 Tax=Aegicerativicinus sediminis TaxID=2893202 RepID=UPI001E5EA904|nr:histidinol dehydrogenase [Aegicerativicinus sediminis]
MKVLENPSRDEWETIVRRPTPSLQDLEPLVSEVFADIQVNGDTAISAFTSRYDRVDLDRFQVSEIEIDEAISNINPDLKKAILIAKDNIEAFHKAQQTDFKPVETTKGVSCWQVQKPIEKVGLYIPGGTAPLFSTVLMLAIPANIAGCKEIILCSPPNKSGSLPDEILFAASMCGVTKIFKVGGIQAIAALTFGTDTIPKVNKIFGPGNQFVTVAKQYATKFGLAIDMPAGPSELLVYADETAVPAYVAADLLSQAEHGKDSQVILVSNSLDILKKVLAQLDIQLRKLPRIEMAKSSIENSKLVYLPIKEDALDFINMYGPEHFIICTQNEEFFVNGIINAGSVFIGNYSPESAGDYASGTNHTLPTNGYSKTYSGVNLNSFTKAITFQKLSSEGLINLGPTIEIMAEAEGLFAHKNAVSLRLNDLTNGQ